MAIVWLFRRRLEDLLPMLRAKYKDFAISFRLEQAEKEVAALPPAPTPAEAGSEPTPEERGRFEQIAEVSPRAAILELRRELEEFLKGVASEYNLDARPMSIASITRMLRSRNLIDSHTSALLDDLRAIGNAAAHAGNETQFSKEDAQRFRLLAEELFRRFATIKNTLIADPNATSL
ncbi:MAG: DUF4145 domain-containing protein [Steroidobacteraceae bacterium]